MALMTISAGLHLRGQSALPEAWPPSRIVGVLYACLRGHHFEFSPAAAPAFQRPVGSVYYIPA